MKRRILWTSFGVALIVAGITAASTQTQQWQGGPPWFHHGPLSYVAHELNLSDAQKAQIKSIWEGERPNIAEAIHELASEQKEMDALTSEAGAPGDSRIQDIAQHQGATLARLFVEKEQITNKIYSQVLNPAQRTKADELRKRWYSHLERVADQISNASGRE